MGDVLNYTNTRSENIKRGGGLRKTFKSSLQLAVYFQKFNSDLILVPQLIKFRQQIVEGGSLCVNSAPNTADVRSGI